MQYYKSIEEDNKSLEESLVAYTRAKSNFEKSFDNHYKNMEDNLKDLQGKLSDLYGEQYFQQLRNSLANALEKFQGAFYNDAVDKIIGIGQEIEDLYKELDKELA